MDIPASYVFSFLFNGYVADLDEEEEEEDTYIEVCPYCGHLNTFEEGENIGTVICDRCDYEF